MNSNKKITYTLYALCAIVLVAFTINVNAAMRAECTSGCAGDGTRTITCSGASCNCGDGIDWLWAYCTCHDGAGGDADVKVMDCNPI